MDDFDRIAADAAQEIESLGISTYDIKIDDQSVSFGFPQPQTVAQLRTLAGFLHFKYLKSASGTVIGTIYALARSRDAKPVGLVKEEAGKPIIETAKLVTTAVADLPGKPCIDSPMLNNRSWMEVIQHAELQRWLNSKYLGIATTNKGGRPSAINYDRGFELLATGECESYQDAYKRVIAEMDDDSPEKYSLLTNLDDYQEGLLKFKSAMTYRRGKFK